MDNLVHGSNFLKRDIGVDRVNRGGNALAHRGGIAIGSHYEPSTWPGTLLEWNLDHWEAFVANARVVNIAGHPHDLPFHWRTEFCLSGDELFDDNTLAKRIHTGQKPLDKSFIHNGDSRGSR